MKQVILVRQDLKLPKGKLAAQSAHASVECVLKTDRRKVQDWHDEGMKKIVVKVKDLEELKKYITEARSEKLTTCLITDAGLTTVKPGTVTCGAIGPDDDSKIDKITHNLKIL